MPPCFDPLTFMAVDLHLFLAASVSPGTFLHLAFLINFPLHFPSPLVSSQLAQLSFFFLLANNKHTPNTFHKVLVAVCAALPCPPRKGKAGDNIA